MPAHSRDLAGQGFEWPGSYCLAWHSIRTPSGEHDVQAPLSPAASPVPSGVAHWHVGTITISWPLGQSGISVGWSSWGMPCVLLSGDCADAAPAVGAPQRFCNCTHSGEARRPLQLEA
jgi:hypothetical protein